MILSSRLNSFLCGIVCGAALVLAAGVARAQEQPVERTNITIEVKEADTGQPIANARLTLQFREPRKFRRGKPTAFNAKTNPQGHYKFLDIPKGPIRLLVTAEHRQSYGKDLEVTEDNQVFLVKLKRPQPLL